MLYKSLRNHAFTGSWIWIGVFGLLFLLMAAPAMAAGPGISIDSAADTTTPGDSACTLREAIANANADIDTTGGDCLAGSGDDTLTFADALVGQTITLSGTELAISSNLTIVGPGASQLAVSGNNASRVFNITAGTVTISGLTVRNGQISGAHGAGMANAGTLTLDGVAVTANTISGGGTTQGGGIYNTGTLTVTHSAISANSSLGTSGRGGGIAAVGSGSASIINSTISGNTAASSGGGLVNADSSVMTLLNSTISGNAATNFNGGGLEVLAAVSVKNTIIANNTDKNGPNDCYYLFTQPTSQGYNLVENTGNCTFAATGDQTGTDPKLGVLADNDGETMTHFPQAGSPAIDAIPAGSNGCNDVVSDDQRGYLRATGKACDVGAVEYNGIHLTMTQFVSDAAPQPAQTITYTLVVSLRQSGNANLSNSLISDTMPAGINFVGPVAVSGGSGAITGAPTALVSGLGMTGGTIVTVTFPATVSTGLAAGTTIVNTAGITSAEVTAPITASVGLTVSNIGPAAGADTFSVLEDSGSTGLDVRANDIDLNGDSIPIVAVGPTNNGGAAAESGGQIAYAPAANFNGTEVFSYTISDGLVSDTTTVTVTVQAVNDVPVFSGGDDQWRIQTAGAQTVSGWATGISPGPADEAGQSLTFHLTADDPALFSAAPAIDSAGGDLTFTPNATAGGSMVVTVTLQDDGGTANGGVDTTVAQTFTLVIAPGDAVAAIDPATGGSMAYTDTVSGLGAWVQVPGGAVSAPTDLVFDELDSPDGPPPGSFLFAGRAFAIDAWQNMALQTGFVFGTPITLTLSYNPADLGFVDEGTLTLFAWDGSAWTTDGLTVISRDPAAHRVTVVIGHLSDFVLFGQAPDMHISKQLAGRSDAGSGSFGTFGSLNLPLGGVVTYTVTLSNSGGFVARGVVMTDDLPAGVSFAGWAQQGSAQLPGNATVAWGPHDIQPGAAYTIEFTVDVTHAAQFAEQTIINTARFNSDNAGSGADSAALWVAANTAPSISGVGNQAIRVSRSLTLPITMSDLETPPDMLALSGASSNPGLVSASDIQFSGSGANRTVTITPATGITGTAAITLTVTDGGGLTDSSSFQLMVSMTRVYLPLVLK